MGLEAIKEFFQTVDWTEPWLVILLFLHAATTVAIILARRQAYIQACILGVLGVLCLASERLNEFAAMNYEKFAGQQYFDSSGFFISIIFAGPIIFNCFLIVLCWLWSAWVLMGRIAVAKATRQQRSQRSESKKKQ